jgi:hypothetical protein
VTLKIVQIPLVINAAETAYVSKSGQPGKSHTVKRKMTSGGVINPPTIAKQCCNPIINAKKYGIFSSVYMEESWDEIRVLCCKKK